MTSQEEAILAQVDAQLNAMDAPTSAEVFYGLEEFSPRHQVAAAARVAKSGGGGGGGVRLLGPFHFDYTDFPASNTIIEIFTPTAGDQILKGIIDNAGGTIFNDSGSTDFALGEDPDFDNAHPPATFWGMLGPTGDVSDTPPNSDSTDAAYHAVGYISTGLPMKIRATSIAGDGTSGAMDLYFLVATASLP